MLLGQIYIFQEKFAKIKKIRPVNSINLNARFYEKYEMNVEQPLSNNINSFEQIAWIDPYPQETDVTDDLFKVPLYTEDLIYEHGRYHEEYQPLMIYIPRKDVMMKLMRACIGIKNERELWFEGQKIKKDNKKEKVTPPPEKNEA